MKRLLMKRIVLAVVLGCTSVLLTSCAATIKHQPQTVLAVFAHPDDETWVSGTLARLVAKGFEVIPVYVTSGDAGKDRTGAGLKGKVLADAREVEALDAAKALGLSMPRFLRYPDGQVKSDSVKIEAQLDRLVDKHQPQLVVTFDLGGVTGHFDHIAIGQITTKVTKGEAVYFAVSQSRAEQLAHYAAQQGVPYKIAKPAANGDISLTIDVADYAKNRIEAMAAHSTQFPAVMVKAFSGFVTNVSTEELIVPSGCDLPESVVDALVSASK